MQPWHRGQEATDLHSPLSVLIREMMGKHADAGEEKNDQVQAKRLENVQLCCGSQDAICVLNAVLWAINHGHTAIQLPPPFLH